jgi:alkanesulfonate monooxygenase SsuD/methylene tetrahydromethanopterin reductase-like flavin-dependent oxidoreductase (luciferase family)
MRFVLMTEPQLGGSYNDLVHAAQAAEQAGLDAFSRSDHYYSGKPGLPTTDAFTTMGGIAREVRRVRLCVLVSPITFRHPAVIAKAATSIDEMSGGRFDMGVGTGWMEAEHAAFGLPFHPLTERFDRLEECLAYLRAAFSGEEFAGRYYRIDADVRPRPTSLRLIVGGSGTTKTPDLAGRFADEYNHPLVAPDQLRAKIERVRESAAAAGRDPSSITLSVMGPALLASGKDRLTELVGNAASLRGDAVGELEERWSKSWVPRGAPADAAAMFDAFEAVGVSKYYLQWFDLTDRPGVVEQAQLAAEVGR